MRDPDDPRKRYLECKRDLDEKLARLRELRKGRPRSTSRLIPLRNGSFFVLGTPSDLQILCAVATIPIVE